MEQIAVKGLNVTQLVSQSSTTTTTCDNVQHAAALQQTWYIRDKVQLLPYPSLTPVYLWSEGKVKEGQEEEVKGYLLHNSKMKFRLFIKIKVIKKN